MIKISVVHPTARIAPPYPSFPTGWLESCQAFCAACDSPEDVEYILVVHEDNWQKFCQRYGGTVFEGQWLNSGLDCVDRFGRFWVVKNRGTNSVVSQINHGCVVARGLLIHVSMDDLFPPRHWDSLIWRAFAGSNLSTLDSVINPHVLHVTTGSPTDDTLFIPQIFTRMLFEERGYAVHPSYDGMFSDNEFTEHAKAKGIVLDGRHIRYEHRHPAFGTAEMDSVYAGENREQAYADGLRNFEYRKALCFPRESEPQHAPVKHALVKPYIALCAPGEIFHQEWLVGWTNLILWLSLEAGFNLHMMFAHTSNVYCTRMEITEAVLAMRPKPHLWLWLDDDNTITREQLALLIQDLVEHPELDGVVGWCWCDREDDPENPFMMSCGKQDEQMRLLRFGFEDFDKAESPLIPIEWSGFPCVLIRNEAMEKLGAQAFKPILRDDVNFGFTSEDTSFFWNARQMGMKFAVDARVKVPHVKYRKIEPQYVPRPPQQDIPGTNGKGMLPSERLENVEAD